jgi:hypothetical protein
VPTSGATVPLPALPGFHRTLGEFQPLRQITGVARSILYYDTRGDAGLCRGWVILGLGLAVACLFGFGVTRFYDHKGTASQSRRQGTAAGPRSDTDRRPLRGRAAGSGVGQHGTGAASSVRRRLRSR